MTIKVGLTWWNVVVLHRNMVMHL